MATPSDISVGLVHELTITATKVGWEPKDFADLAHGEEKLRQILSYVRGYAKITSTKYVIDCDTKPFVPQGWKVEEHKKGGQLILDVSRIKLHLSPNQVYGKYIQGNKLRKELASELTLNANVLDYLLAHPELIPEEWKGKYTFFWGTIYRISGGYLYVRSLYFGGGAWLGGYRWLGDDFLGYSPAAVLAS